MDRLIIDSDFLIGYVLYSDPHHSKVVNFLEKINDTQFLCTNLVQYEVATVLSRLEPQPNAIKLFDEISWDSLQMIWLEEKLTGQALQIYRSQTKKNISITDCANLALAKKFDLKIASFDQFYPAQFRI